MYFLVFFLLIHVEVPVIDVCFVVLVRIVLAVGVMLFVVLKFRRKKDGLGFKTMLKWWFIVWVMFNPAYFAIQIWLAFTDFPYYATAIRVLILFVFMNSLFFVSSGWPIYLTFVESAQRGLSSISLDVDDESDDRQIEEEVLRLARDRTLIELNVRSTEAEETRVATDGPGPEETEAAVPVYSSKTLALTLGDIVLNPKYAAQLLSFSRHLIGEFNVEGLLFFLRVLRFRKYVRSVRSPRASGRGQDNGSMESVNLEDNSNSATPSRFSASSSNDVDESVSVKDVVDEEDGIADKDIDVAWEALLVYFEFLVDGAPSQVRPLC